MPDFRKSSLVLSRLSATPFFRNAYNIGLMEKKMETTTMGFRVYGTMEKKIETTMVYWVYIGMMEKKMETIIWGLGFS